MPMRIGVFSVQLSVFSKKYKWLSDPVLSKNRIQMRYSIEESTGLKTRHYNCKEKGNKTAPNNNGTCLRAGVTNARVARTAGDATLGVRAPRRTRRGAGTF